MLGNKTSHGEHLHLRLRLDHYTTLYWLLLLFCLRPSSPRAWSRHERGTVFFSIVRDCRRHHALFPLPAWQATPFLAPFFVFSCPVYFSIHSVQTVEICEIYLCLSSFAIYSDINNGGGYNGITTFPPPKKNQALLPFSGFILYLYLYRVPCTHTVRGINVSCKTPPMTELHSYAPPSYLDGCNDYSRAVLVLPYTSWDTLQVVLYFLRIGFHPKDKRINKGFSTRF